MRRGLVVGIDHYLHSPLKGCIADARRIGTLLERHEDESRNFFCNYLLSENRAITTQVLWSSLIELFNNPADSAIFYFAGHGSENELGGYLVTQKARKHEEGISLNQLFQLANNSNIREIVIIIDACHSGYAGNLYLQDQVTLREGIAVLCSSLKSQLAFEKDGGGVFTSLLCESLHGAGADLVGNVSLGQIYNFSEKLLNPWEQRPMFKANLSHSIYLRRCKPIIPLSIIRKLPLYFPTADHVYCLSPSYEPTAQPRDPEREAILRDLQRFRSKGILEPNGTEHLYHAAMENKSCSLTRLGKIYWQMAEKGIF